MENVKILSISEKEKLGKALLYWIEYLEKTLDEITPIDDYGANLLKELFTKEIFTLKKLTREILCANEIQIRS